MKVLDTEIKVIWGDITTLKVEAIVNTSNNVGSMGGGVAASIRSRGGVLIEQEALKKGPFDIGGAIYTSAGQLDADYVIHTATMGMDFKTDQDKVRLSCASALVVANDLGVGSMVFPALGCGVGKFPLKGAMKIMVQEVVKFIRRCESLPRSPNDVSLKEIIFCLYDQEAFDEVYEMVNAYLHHIVDVLGDEPYKVVDIIIELDEGIVLIERSNPPYGWALPGGFLDLGESLKQAAIREAKEETDMDLDNIREFKTYSDINRDPRFHTVSTVFVARGCGIPQFGDDAKGLRVISYDDVSSVRCAFDHNHIINEYLTQMR